VRARIWYKPCDSQASHKVKVEANSQINTATLCQPCGSLKTSTVAFHRPVTSLLRRHDGPSRRLMQQCCNLLVTWHICPIRFTHSYRSKMAEIFDKKRFLWLPLQSSLIKLCTKLSNFVIKISSDLKGTKKEFIEYQLLNWKVTLFWKLTQSSHFDTAF